jgi:hypothetical protein
MALGGGGTSQATFTPAATAHSIADVYGGAQEFKNCGSIGKRAMIRSASMRIDDNDLEALPVRCDTAISLC